MNEGNNLGVGARADPIQNSWSKNEIRGSQICNPVSITVGVGQGKRQSNFNTFQ